MDQLMDRGKPIKTKNVKRRRTVRNAISIGLSANQDSFAAVSEQLSQTEQLTIDVNSIDRFSRSPDHLLPSFGPVETEPDENFSNFEPEDDGVCGSQGWGSHMSKFRSRFGQDITSYC